MKETSSTNKTNLVKKHLLSKPVLKRPTVKKETTVISIYPKMKAKNDITTNLPKKRHKSPS